MKPTVVVTLVARHVALAERIKGAIPEAELHLPVGLNLDADYAFTATAEHLRHLYQDGHPIVGIMATGILIRALASVLTDKRTEPPVLAVAADSGTAIPLLGGHQGANRLAQRLGDALGSSAAITTASDVEFGVALDDPPAGWTLANPNDHKTFASRLLAGATVTVLGTPPSWLRESRLSLDGGELTIEVTPTLGSPGPTRLVYQPRRLTVGVGCERNTDPDELSQLVRETLSSAGLATAAVVGFFSIDVKMDEPAVNALGRWLDVPVRFFDAASLEAEAPRLANPSDVVFAEVGCHGVAEGAALAAAGPDGELIVQKHKSSRATCAIALAPAPITTFNAGLTRGHLSVVGLGPGDPMYRIPNASTALREADTLVGFSGYLDLIEPALRRGKKEARFGLGEEQRRVRHALELAAEGKRVALVCSGDPGIYAMATLVFEEVEHENNPRWSRIDVEVIPGISALQTAAAKAGAPLGHDFCAISLSDLLTPWSVIEQRIAGAAAGDFVVALYNPVSKRRRWQLEAALKVFREHRPGSTPVVIGRNLGRPGENMSVVDLESLTVDHADMLTVLVIGSSITRNLPRASARSWVYTPRGYRNARNSE